MPLTKTGNAQLDQLIARQLRYGQTRWAEVLLASLMVAVGVCFMLPGRTFDLPSFRIIAGLWHGREELAGLSACAVGGLRLHFLWLNGRRQNGPVARLFGCFFGLIFWTGWIYGFARTFPPVVPLMPMSVVLALGELVAGTRVVRDLYAYNSLGLRKRERARSDGPLL